MLRILVSILLLALAACSGKGSMMNLGQGSFEEYRLQSEDWIQRERDFQTKDPVLELSYNSPKEWRPDGKAYKGILLVHGLGDSPYTFEDAGPIFANRGYLTRAILLPGCGTKPSDLICVTHEDSMRVIEEQAAILGAEVQDLYLGGFSNGCNLVLEYAYEHPEVKGLVLFGPAIKSDVPLAFLAPVVSLFTDWIMKPGGKRKAQGPVRYNVTPTAAFAQFYYASSAARRLLRKKPYDKPVVAILSERDSILDVPYILGLFDKSFAHPDSRLIYYGKAVPGLSKRAYPLPDYLPEWRISSFSHMGVLFSPGNKLFGFNSPEPMCFNGQTEEITDRCLAGEEVWYSAHGHREAGKVHARLTFNPYFDWQMAVIVSVLDKAGEDPQGKNP
jgi:pimeloyl-ACP methyl ester carboxylesterase